MFYLAWSVEINRLIECFTYSTQFHGICLHVSLVMHMYCRMCYEGPVPLELKCAFVARISGDAA